MTSFHDGLMSATTYILQLLLDIIHHGLLDDQPAIIDVLDDDVLRFAVEVHYDGLDGWLTFYEHACEGMGISVMLRRE